MKDCSATKADMTTGETSCVCRQLTARQMRADGNEARASLLRASRVPAGGPEPQK